MWLKIANTIFSDNWIVQNKQTVLVHIIKYPVIFFGGGNYVWQAEMKVK